jgi:hypothetical protein
VIAAGEIANFAPRKIALTTFFRLQERNPYAKPALPNNFSLGPEKAGGSF